MNTFCPGNYRFLRLSKYLVPLDASSLHVYGGPKANRLITPVQVRDQFPELVRIYELGLDSEWGNFYQTTIRDGEIAERFIAPHPKVELTVGVYKRSGVIGRHCRMIGPDNRWISERGYYPDAKPVSLKQLANPKFWLQSCKAHLAQHRRLPSPQRLPGTAVLLNNRSPHNFYHWMLEVVPRIFLMRRAGLSADWYLVDSQSTFQQRVLWLLGIDLKQVIQPHFALHLQPDTMIRPSEPGLDAILDFASAVRTAVTSGTSSRIVNRKLYITRREAAHRKVENEQEVEQFLSRRGFEAIAFESISFDQQAQLMSGAEAVVAVHGAALANLIFAEPNTPVVEICPSNRYNIDCFPRVSHSLGLRHFSVLSKCRGRSQSIRVDLNDLAVALARLGVN